jgi:hypothetical integral membrane protein (TIGR02206 family)
MAVHPRYWTKDYAGRPFVFLGAPHLAFLIGVALLNVSWPWLRPVLDADARLALRIIMAMAVLANEAVYHLWSLTTGQWTLRTMLPLHLCSFLVYLTPVMLLSGHPWVYEFCYFLGVGAASQALLTPDAGRYGFPHVRFFTAMISHSLLLTAPLYMTLVEGYAPTWASLGRVLVEALAFAAVVFVVNRRLGSNYMYLARPPDTPSLIDRLGPWPWYIPWLVVIGLSTMLLLYLPFVLFG